MVFRPFCTALVSFCALLAASHAAYADITIATVGPMTGQDAALGEQLQRGVEAAIADINARGGVKGEKLKLLIKDDACDPKQAVAVANQLAGEGVVAIIGHMCSGAAIPASRVYHEEGLLLVSPSATNPMLTEQGFDTIFRVCGRDDQQGVVVGDYIVKHLRDKKIAIVHDKTAYGRGIADQVKRTINASGIREVAFEAVTKGERDFSALISKLKQSGVEVIYFGGFDTEGGLMIRQLQDQGMKTLFIGSDGLSTKQFWGIAGNAAEGALMSFGQDPRKNPDASDAVTRLRQSGYDPDGYTLYSYAAVQIIADAMAKSATPDPAQIAKAMHEGTFKTVLGPISFDRKGDISRPDFVMYRWTKGSYAQMDE